MNISTGTSYDKNCENKSNVNKAEVCYALFSVLCLRKPIYYYHGIRQRRYVRPSTYNIQGISVLKN